MSKSPFIRAVLAAALALACACGLAACVGSAASGGGAATSENAVAATVNGTPIQESAVTERIEQIRSQSGNQDVEAWGQYLFTSGLAPDVLRRQIIDSLVDEELMKAGAESLGATVDSAVVDEWVASSRANYGTDEEWVAALEESGFTEESFRASIEQSQLQQAVNEHFAKDVKVTDKDTVETAKLYLPSFDGARRSQHILFATDDKETAQEVLDRINAGELEFADAVAEYSSDKSAGEDGDIGWDRLAPVTTEYQEALGALEADQISGLVEASDGIHIIRCTEVYEAPEDVASVDDIPEAFRDTIDEMAKSTKTNDAYQAWLAEQREAAEIVVNDMPADVSYNVDMSKYNDGATEEPASGESASSESASPEAASAESASAEAASGEAAPSAEPASGESASSESASPEAASSASASADAR